MQISSFLVFTVSLSPSHPLSRSLFPFCSASLVFLCFLHLSRAFFLAFLRFWLAHPRTKNSDARTALLPLQAPCDPALPCATSSAHMCLQNDIARNSTRHDCALRRQRSFSSNPNSTPTKPQKLSPALHTSAWFVVRTRRVRSRFSRLASSTSSSPCFRIAQHDQSAEEVEAVIICSVLDVTRSHRMQNKCRNREGGQNGAADRMEHELLEALRTLPCPCAPCPVDRPCVYMSCVLLDCIACNEAL